ncbi:hypothetical protein HanPI659440_Chr12g0466151 [Helianthus annuus]|nr:hypothetical protein HanPI659440_Chr12g0466151 [Helianthus annuus]
MAKEAPRHATPPPPSARVTPQDWICRWLFPSYGLVTFFLHFSSPITFSPPLNINLTNPLYKQASHTSFALFQTFKHSQLTT